MNRASGVNANPNKLLPRQLVAGFVIAVGTIGVAGCSANGPQEIAESNTPVTPVECAGEALYSFEVGQQVEAIKQNIDNILCVTANDASAQALATYRENDSLIISRDEGPDDKYGQTYNFNYLDYFGTYVSVEFGITSEGGPDLSDLRRIYLKEEISTEEGDTSTTVTTSMSRLDSGLWTITGHTYVDDGPLNDWHYNPSDVSNQQDLSAMQDAQDKVFELSLNFNTL